MKNDTLVIGTGAGYAGDRVEPAIELAKHGNLDYIVFECLAERTIALAQLRKLRDPSAGYDSLLAYRLDKILPVCYQNKIKIITNMGAANPLAALEKTREIARKHGLDKMKIAAVIGDDVSGIIGEINPCLVETGQKLNQSLGSFVSANAYLGAESIIPALETGADVVITGRVADPSLFLAPMIYEFGWSLDNWTLLGKGTVIGHLMECAGQVTGGYYAEPGKKDVPGLGRLGFPIACIAGNGDGIITKLPGAGGIVNVSTCKEQLLYEIGDPAAYLTPDVTADFTKVGFKQIGPDKVLVTGGDGRRRPPTLKVSIGYHQGYIGEGEISYAGSGAVERGRLAAQIVKERLEAVGATYREIRYDLIGVDALHGAVADGKASGKPYEVRLRVAAKTDTREEAILIGNEVETLYTNGPAGGGGARKHVSEIIAIVSAFIPRESVASRVVVKEVNEG
ncbi:MAG: DUF1446 domain-containing protein [Peptococcaceae bacterium]|jgi:hypothetical protein|nr:DUF1446 domain-containing protein [Peptococcaceae bacterium]MDH7523922.1 DUF1446 domain-containing protein [Peptococcaceae bacterium]